MEYIMVVLIFSTIFMYVYFILSHLLKGKTDMVIRLNAINKFKNEAEQVDLNQSLFIRFLKPLFDDFSKTILKVTPKEIIRVYEKKVIVAGNPFNLSVKDWINIIVIATIGLPILTIICGLSVSMASKNLMFLVIFEISLGIILPSLILNSNGKKRKKHIVCSLPDVMDLLTVSVEAGLGFDSALSKVVEKIPGPLSSEFEQVLNEVKVGKQKRDALRNMSERLAINEITTFISSIIQAEQLGVSIGNVLRIQSEQMRQRRRQVAQEKAMKAPIKMLIPMVIFIFPTIFLVLLGPVVVQMMTSK